MKFLFSLMLALLLGGGGIEPRDNEVTRTVDVPDFRAIECSLPCDVKYESGRPGVVISADEHLIDKVSVKVEDGTLKIKFTDRKLRNIKGVRLFVTSSVLNALTFNGACDFECERGIVSVGDFTLCSNGASDCEIGSLKADNARIILNGASDCDIEGLRCKSLVATINGVGDLNLQGICNDATLTINGAGDIDVKGLVCDVLDSTINGAGSISRR